MKKIVVIKAFSFSSFVRLIAGLFFCLGCLAAAVFFTYSFLVPKYNYILEGRRILVYREFPEVILITLCLVIGSILLALAFAIIVYLPYKLFLSTKDGISISGQLYIEEEKGET